MTAAQSIVKVTPQGLQFNALNTNHNSTLSEVLKAVKLEEDAQATAQMIASLFQQ